VHKRFLLALRNVLPRGCRPIIVGDAGFHGPFFREVERLGWDFLGRLRGRTTMRPEESQHWTSVRKLYRRATPTATDLGSFRVYQRAKGLSSRLVLVRQVRTTRHPWRRILSANHVRTMTGSKDPWLLVTSLRTESALDVARIYGTRMQIEETFRDTKNQRFGWCLRQVRSSSQERLAALLLLCALAMLAVTLIGMTAEGMGLHRAFQANTVRRRVLSHFVLGLALLRSHMRVSAAGLRTALGLMRCKPAASVSLSH
jgi:Transposase DDE domain